VGLARPLQAWSIWIWTTFGTIGTDYELIATDDACDIQRKGEIDRKPCQLSKDGCETFLGGLFAAVVVSVRYSRA
jgi:hypothetical protein